MRAKFVNKTLLNKKIVTTSEIMQFFRAGTLIVNHFKFKIALW
jgi:hypothetical protein